MGDAHVILIDAYEVPSFAANHLYNLLQEREPHQNISHRRMPAWHEHVAFFKSRPYLHWYVFHAEDDKPAGAVYLSKQREIGVGVLKAYRGQGLGRAAVQEIIRLHPGRFLANINPANEASAKLFKSLGFNIIQHTYSHG